MRKGFGSNLHCGPWRNIHKADKTQLEKNIRKKNLFSFYRHIVSYRRYFLNKMGIRHEGGSVNVNSFPCTLNNPKVIYGEITGYIKYISYVEHFNLLGEWLLIGK